MQIEVMNIKDIDLVVPLYIEYYNNHEDGCWTEETAKRRIRQVLTMEGAYSLMLKDDEGEVCGFVMGYYKQYDDIVGYTLEEIIIAVTRDSASALRSRISLRLTSISALA